MVFLADLAHLVTRADLIAHGHHVTETLPAPPRTMVGKNTGVDIPVAAVASKNTATALSVAPKPTMSAPPVVTMATAATIAPTATATLAGKPRKKPNATVAMTACMDVPSPVVIAKTSSSPDDLVVNFWNPITTSSGFGDPHRGGRHFLSSQPP